MPWYANEYLLVGGILAALTVLIAQIVIRRRRAARRLQDPNYCLDRAASLLGEPPTADRLAKATQLLQLAEEREPTLEPAVLYWRAVAAVHAKDVETAAKQLGGIFDASRWPADDAARRDILFRAWQLALLAHSEVEKRITTEQLTMPGRRMEAIDSVERVLTESPQDPIAWSLKRVLYAPLTESEFRAGPLGKFDYVYVEQLGLALLDDATRLGQGIMFLSIAASGLPADAPRLWKRASDALDAHGNPGASRQARLNAEQAGVSFGPSRLPEESKQAFCAAAKRLADEATAAGHLDEAVKHLHHYAESGMSGLETLRQLADLHERRGDALAAARIAEQALVYDATNRDWLARKDKYYYSLTPDMLAGLPDAARQGIDVDYCLTKATQLINHRDADEETLQWASHLVELALALQPQGIRPRVLASRLRLSTGHRDEALQLLEDVRESRPATATENEAWHLACRLLGDLYLNDYDRPDLAIACYQDFRKSDKSGADTLYKLGLAHERLGEAKRAAKYFEQVASYGEHPRAPDAREALRRLKP